MKFDVYCDESRPDAIHSENCSDSRLVIGSLWLPTDQRVELKTAIHALRNKHKVGGEFKWQKLSPSRIEFYLGLLDLFFSRGEELRFRCISVQRDKLDLIKFHQGDQELGFYKFYYQLLHHWILDLNDYSIFCDHKQNRDHSRLSTLRRCLDSANLSSQIQLVQAVRSEESVLVQLVDVLTGVAAARLNQSINPGSAKERFAQALEGRLGHAVRPTWKSEQKFNVFEIQPGGGW